MIPGSIERRLYRMAEIKVSMDFLLFRIYILLISPYPHEKEFRLPG